MSTAQPATPSPGEIYQREMVPASFARWAPDLVDLGAVRPGQRVLDVACGTGVVTRIAAERAGPSGRVAGLDVNADMLAAARAASPGARIEWYEGSALALPFPDGSFDIVVCQQGLQFFPDRVAGLREMRRVLTAGGRLALSCWRSVEHQPVTWAPRKRRHRRCRLASARRSAGSSPRPASETSASERKPGPPVTLPPTASCARESKARVDDEGLAFPQAAHIATAVA